jgi:hypothetical protein
MTETIQARQSKQTENYGVYDSPDGDERQSIVGTYIALAAAEQLGEFAEFIVSDEEDESLTLTQEKTTGNYGVYSDEAEAVETTYISHEVLAEVTDQDAESDEYEAPESLSMTARPSDEEAFEAALDEVTVDEEETEEAADALVAGSQDGEEEQADDSDEEQTTDEAADDLVEVSDEAAGIAD